MRNMVIAIVLVYTLWAFYSGYQVVSGRIEWLDRKAPANMAVKLIVSLGAGYVIGAFYLIYLILKLMGLVR